MTEESPMGQNRVRLQYDPTNGWFAHVSGHQVETEVNANTPEGALRALADLTEEEDFTWHR